MGNDSKDFSEIHPLSWVNTHHDVTDLQVLEW